ncbi:hypothetical protein CPB97_009975 [Podila verticillata]|nr:hypothetical protein CPB97_009975 [Podila verticillata]
MNEEMEKLEMAGVTLQVDGMNQEQIQDEIQCNEQLVSQLDHCYMLQETLFRYNGHRELSPRFFIVLPTDLPAWDDSNISAHKFRLYYLCDINPDRDQSKDMLAHFHFANHPGYILNRPQEFFKVYGDYVLRMLMAVRKSCDILHSRRFRGGTVPLKETLKNLWDSVRFNSDRRPSKDITPLVDMAIKYLERLSPPKEYPTRKLTQLECIEVKSFFDIQDGDNATGDLCRLWTHV